MKRFNRYAAIPLAIALFLAGCQYKASGGAGAPAKASFHIGVVLGTFSPQEDALLGLGALEKRYGDADSGGIIRKIVFSSPQAESQAASVPRITALAEDPLIRAVILIQPAPGTIRAFEAIREKRPDILLLVGEAQDDPLVVQADSDLAVNCDFIARGYTVVWAARELGARTLVHISDPRSLVYEPKGRRLGVMAQACEDLGLAFKQESVPDSRTGGRVREYILEKTPQWVQKYGKDSAFFCADNAYSEPLIESLLKYGGIFAESDLPSPLSGYVRTLGLETNLDAGGYPALLKSVEQAIVDRGGAGRFGTWPFGFGYAVTAGLGEFAKQVIEGKMSKDSLQGLKDALTVYTPGAEWHGAYYIDADTGVRSKNQVLFFMDTYVLGKGYLPTTKRFIPERYYAIRSGQE